MPVFTFPVDQVPHLSSMSGWSAISPLCSVQTAASGSCRCMQAALSGTAFTGQCINFGGMSLRMMMNCLMMTQKDTASNVEERAIRQSYWRKEAR